ncbi:hypothetical protein SRHO_G00195880 [Serrasalmus rhombeus]
MASTDDPDESAQRSRAESQQTTPTDSPEIDQPDIKDMSEVSEEDTTATSAEKSSRKKSPHLKHPSLKVDNAHMHMLTPMGRVKTTKTWKTVEIEDRLRKLSIKHPGMETKEMMTPVQIKVNLTLKERDHLTFDQIKQIEFTSQSGLNQYLKTLALYKRRDFWNSWKSLQTYCRLHRCKHFPQTFSTYSWSWSTCRNMLEVTELLQSKESPSQALEKFPPMQKGLLHIQKTNRRRERCKP